MTIATHLAVSFSCNDVNFSILARVPIDFVTHREYGSVGIVGRSFIEEVDSGFREIEQDHFLAQGVDVCDVSCVHTKPREHTLASRWGMEEREPTILFTPVTGFLPNVVGGKSRRFPMMG